MNKRKLLLPAGAAVLCAGLLMGAFFQSQSGPKRYKTLTLTPTLLQNTISATGTVESVDRALVYAPLNYPVAEQAARVGNRVEAGDVLCRLDSAALERQITQQRATLNAAARTARQQIDAARKTCDNYEQSLANGMDSALLNAQNQVTSSKNSLDQAQRKLDGMEADQSNEYSDYKDARYDYANSRAALKTAENSLTAAKRALAEAQASGAPEEQLGPLRDDVLAKEAVRSSAEARLQIDQGSYEGARQLYKSVADAFDQAEFAAHSAQTTYDAAKKSLEAAQLAASQKLDTYKDNLKNAEANADNEAGAASLQALQAQLDDTVVTAPVSGTVTAIYAKPGAPAAGLLYVIENTGRLQVATGIKEYDVTQVKPGIKATITSDATRDGEYSGTLTQVAPTAQKAADGSTLSGTNVAFDATVAVDRDDTPLRVGMNVRLNLVLAEKANVFAAPYDAVVKQGGKTLVFEALPGQKGSYTARAIEVTTGMETDFFIELQSPELTEGMRLIANPDGLSDGDRVTLETAAI